jgi:hypothetical protein
MRCSGDGLTAHEPPTTFLAFFFATVGSTATVCECAASRCVLLTHMILCAANAWRRMQCPLPQISQPLAGHGTHKAGHGDPTVIESSIYDCSVRGDQLPCWLGSPRCATHVADGCCAPTHFSCHVMPALSSQSRPMSSAIVDVQRT